MRYRRYLLAVYSVFPDIAYPEKIACRMILFIPELESTGLHSKSSFEYKYFRLGTKTWDNGYSRKERVESVRRMSFGNWFSVRENEKQRGKQRRESTVCGGLFTSASLEAVRAELLLYFCTYAKNATTREIFLHFDSAAYCAPNFMVNFFL
jgi:hypothetical protein